MPGATIPPNKEITPPSKAGKGEGGVTDRLTAIVTICRDDHFYLKRFVAYYGGLFGRENLYIVSHGDEPEVRALAQGCNVIPIPDTQANNFTILKSRTMNHIKDGLRQWFKHVIVVDVDEFLVVDPAAGMNLREWLDEAQGNTIYTAMGMEIVHMRDREPEGVENGIIGPRMFAQIDLHYAKPCIVSRGGKLARGGHYAAYRKLNMPDFLYLFHMKYCDFGVFQDTLNRRSAFVAEQAQHGDGKVRSNPQWFAKNRDDDAVFAKFTQRPIVQGLDLSHVRQGMHDTWRKRNETLWHFTHAKYEEIYELPERFAGVDRA